MGEKKKKKKNKKNSENGKDNGVHVIDNTPEGGNGVDDAKAALDALSDEQKQALLRDMGWSQRKPREKKDKGPDTRELFDAATLKVGEQAVTICGLLDEFPGPVAVTFERDPDGAFSANVKRVRNKYGPRKGKDD